jgi:hypothetical protein
MAWASVGRGGSIGEVTNEAALDVVLNGVVGSGASVGELLVFAVAVDNASSVNNADNGDVTGVADSGGVNIWTKIRERTVGGGAAQAGATMSLWYSDITSALTTTAVVSATFNSAAASDGTAGIVWRFSKTGNTAVIDSTHVVIATSSNGALDLTAPDAPEYLRFRAVAAESTVTGFTTTSGWTTIGTTRASATIPMAVFGEFRIVSAATAASNCSISAAADNVSIYALFEEQTLVVLGDSVF